jgi:hypothetical protein
MLEARPQLAAERALAMHAAQDPVAAARRNNKGRGGKGADRRPELSLGERFQEVRDFWLKQPPARRRQLLRVPIRRLLQGALAVTSFLGPP